MEQLSIGDNFLITTDNWFYAPDGKKYRSVWGKVRHINDAKETLGIKTNAKSTNWYVIIGNMVIAGCQIHYAIKCENVTFGNIQEVTYGSGKTTKLDRESEIFNANEKS